MGTMVYVIDDDAAQRLKIFRQSRMHDYRETPGLELLKIVVRLLQSQSQNGTASAITHETDSQTFTLKTIFLQDLAEFLAGSR